MRLSMTLLLLGAISFCHNTHAALHQSNERINFQYRAIGKAAWERIYVVSLIYPNVSHTVKSGEILTRMQKSTSRSLSRRNHTELQ